MAGLLDTCNDLEEEGSDISGPDTNRVNNKAGRGAAAAAAAAAAGHTGDDDDYDDGVHGSGGGAFSGSGGPAGEVGDGSHLFGPEPRKIALQVRRSPPPPSPVYVVSARLTPASLSLPA